jgi:putative phosphoesterase
MRIAIISDIHGNLTALDAVIADLKRVGPDFVVHGGDLVGGGSSPAEVIDRIRDLGWPGVYGNADEMLWTPSRITETLQAPHLQRVRDLLLTYTIPATLEAIGNERLAWLRSLPLRWTRDDLTVVHAAPDSAWRSPFATASDDDLERTYGWLGSPSVVYGHIHQPYVRRLSSCTVANSGSVSLSFDGDPRAAYALVDDDRPDWTTPTQIRPMEPVPADLTDWP